MLDWINCMLEFITFLCIYFCFYTDPKFSFIDYCLYFLLGGIVRYDEKSEELCICMDSYSDDIRDDCWKVLSEVLA